MCKDIVALVLNHTVADDPGRGHQLDKGRQAAQRGHIDIIDRCQTLRMGKHLRPLRRYAPSSMTSCKDLTAPIDEANHTKLFESCVEEAEQLHVSTPLVDKRLIKLEYKRDHRRGTLPFIRSGDYMQVLFIWAHQKQQFFEDVLLLLMMVTEGRDVVVVLMW